MTPAHRFAAIAENVQRKRFAPARVIEVISGVAPADSLSRTTTIPNC